MRYSGPATGEPLGTNRQEHVDMFITILTICIVFLGIALILNQKSAKYFLAGYNSMSEEERAKFDIIGFLKSFKLMLVSVAVSLLFIYLLLHHFSLEHYSLILIVIIPLILIPYILYISKKYNNSPVIDNGRSKIIFYWVVGLITVGLPILVAILVFYSGLRETNFEIKSTSLVIDGSYSKEIEFKQIKTVEIVDKLPGIIKRTRGIELGQNLRGKFLTVDGEVYLNVKLKSGSFLKITTNKETIYLSNSSSNVKSLYRMLAEKIE